MSKNERLNMLVHELGDASPRHVGGVGGSYTEEGVWAAKCLAREYGRDALDKLSTKAYSCLTVPMNNLEKLRLYGFESKENAILWLDKVVAHYREFYYEYTVDFEYLRQHLEGENTHKRAEATALLAMLCAGIRMIEYMPYLISMLDDGNEMVRDTALAGLCLFRRKPFLFGNQKAAKWEKWWLKRSKNYKHSITYPPVFKT